MSITESIIERISSGQVMITENVGSRAVAKQMASDLRKWWESDAKPGGADSEAVSDYGRTEVQGWSDSTPASQTVDWRVILISVD
jgi:hypothetical protein